MDDWRVAHVGVDESHDIRIGGLRVWKNTWRRQGTTAVRLPDPNYPGRSHNFLVYEIGDPDKPVVFAAAEVSNTIWCFYERAQDATR
jgi:hypothetical protein